MKIIKVENSTHQEIKVLAAKANLTMKEYINKLVQEDRMTKEQKYERYQEYIAMCLLNGCNIDDCLPIEDFDYDSD